MKTFHEWLAMREGLWLNDKKAVIGLSRRGGPDAALSVWVTQEQEAQKIDVHQSTHWIGTPTVRRS